MCWKHLQKESITMWSEENLHKCIFMNSKVNSLIFCQLWTYSIFILKSAAFYEPLVAIGEDYTADQILLYYLANSSKEAGAVNWKNINLYKGASLYTENYFLKSWGPSEHQLVSVLQPLEFFGPSSCCCCHHYHHRDHVKCRLHVDNQCAIPTPH